MATGVARSSADRIAAAARLVTTANSAPAEPPTTVPLLDAAQIELFHILSSPELANTLTLRQARGVVRREHAARRAAAALRSELVALSHPPPAPARPCCADADERDPLELLRLLADSVLMPVFLTPRLLLSPEVWQQDGARLLGLAEKTSALSSLAAAATRLSASLQMDVPAPPDRLSAELTACIAVVDDVQRVLRPLASATSTPQLHAVAGTPVATTFAAAAGTASTPLHLPANSPTLRGTAAAAAAPRRALIAGASTASALSHPPSPARAPVKSTRSVEAVLGADTSAPAGVALRQRSGDTVAPGASQALQVLARGSDETEQAASAHALHVEQVPSTPTADGRAAIDETATVVVEQYTAALEPYAPLPPAVAATVVEQHAVEHRGWEAPRQSISAGASPASVPAGGSPRRRASTVSRSTGHATPSRLGLRSSIDEALDVDVSFLLEGGGGDGAVARPLPPPRKLSLAANRRALSTADSDVAALVVDNDGDALRSTNPSPGTASSPVAGSFALAAAALPVPVGPSLFKRAVAGIGKSVSRAVASLVTSASSTTSGRADIASYAAALVECSRELTAVLDFTRDAVAGGVLARLALDRAEKLPVDACTMSRLFAVDDAVALSAAASDRSCVEGDAPNEQLPEDAEDFAAARRALSAAALWEFVAIRRGIQRVIGVIGDALVPLLLADVSVLLQRRLHKAADTLRRVREG